MMNYFNLIIHKLIDFPWFIPEVKFHCHSQLCPLGHCIPTCCLGWPTFPDYGLAPHWDWGQGWLSSLKRAVDILSPWWPWSINQRINWLNACRVWWLPGLEHRALLIQEGRWQQLRHSSGTGRWLWVQGTVHHGNRQGEENGWVKSICIQNL